MRRIALLGAAVLGTACIPFAGKEDPFTPDRAPVTETLVAGADTIWVLRTEAYYLLSRHRQALWRKGQVDDVAFQYRWLFGSPPPRIAVRIDSAAAADSAERWRGMPLVVSVMGGKRPENDRRAPVARGTGGAPDVVRRFDGLATRAAAAWMRATADSLKTSFPAWFRAGATLAMSMPAAQEVFAADLRDNGRDVVPLAAMFAAAEAGGPRFGPQAASVLGYLREKDPSFVAALPGELARGRTMGDLLAASGTLPRDVAKLESEWKKWGRRTSRGIPRQVAGGY